MLAQGVQEQLQDLSLSIFFVHKKRFVGEGSRDIQSDLSLIASVTLLELDPFIQLLTLFIVDWRVSALFDELKPLLCVDTE